jgi:uncharacterized membrane protein HdeD (DUF308 family)
MLEPDDVSDEIQLNSWRYLVLATLSIVLGAVGIFYAGLVTITSVFVFGAALVVGGAAQLLHALWSRDSLALPVHVPFGILELVVGGVLLAHPVAALLGFTLLLAAFFIASGIYRIVLATAVRFPTWGWQVASGLVAVLLGLLVFWEWPVSSLQLVGAYISVYLLVNGWTLVMLWLVGRTLADADRGPPSRSIPHPAT